MSFSFFETSSLLEAMRHCWILCHHGLTIDKQDESKGSWAILDEELPEPLSLHADEQDALLRARLMMYVRPELELDVVERREA